MKVEEYILDRTLSKRPCVYARVGTCLYPVLYIQRAKHIADDVFEGAWSILFPLLKEGKQ